MDVTKPNLNRGFESINTIKFGSTLKPIANVPVNLVSVSLDTVIQNTFPNIGFTVSVLPGKICPIPMRKLGETEPVNTECKDPIFEQGQKLDNPENLKFNPKFVCGFGSCYRKEELMNGIDYEMLDPNVNLWDDITDDEETINLVFSKLSIKETVNAIKSDDKNEVDLVKIYKNLKRPFLANLLITFEKMKAVLDPETHSITNTVVYEGTDPVKGDFFVMPKRFVISTADEFWKRLQMFGPDNQVKLSEIYLSVHNKDKFLEWDNSKDWISIKHPNFIDTDNMEKILDVVFNIKFLVNKQHLGYVDMEDNFVVESPLTFSF